MNGKYKMLKSYLSKAIKVRGGWSSSGLFSCGVHYWKSLGDYEYNIHITPSDSGSDIAFTVGCVNNVSKWRAKLDRITSTAEYDTKLVGVVKV